MPHSHEMPRIGLGGGCHWCTEAVFQALGGVDRVEQGFIRAPAPEDSWSEAVIVTFDPAKIDQLSLIEIHLRTHAATSDHTMRSKYRSAVYAFNEAQLAMADRALSTLQAQFSEPLITRALLYQDFKRSEAQFQNYYAANPDRPFCQTHIDPKLALLKRRFSQHLEVSEPLHS
jgi:peptide-methionine (S)-S-oxide reductase